MLPRVSAAIAKFIKPLSTASPGSTSKDGGSGGAPGFEKFKKPDPAPGPKKDHLKLVQPTDAPPKPTHTESPISNETGTSQAWIKIRALLEGNSGIFKWLGVGAYGKSVKASRKAKARKGTMLDEKIG